MKAAGRGLRVTRLRRRRVVWRALAGLSHAAIARLERLAEADLDRLLADPRTLAVTACWEELDGLAVDARLARMAAVAADLIDDALATGDARVAGFVMAELRARRDPRERLAALLLARRAAVHAALPPPGPARAAGPPMLRAVTARARLVRALACELEDRHAAMLPKPPSAAGPAPTGPPRGPGRPPAPEVRSRAGPGGGRPRWPRLWRGPAGRTAEPRWPSSRGANVRSPPSLALSGPIVAIEARGSDRITAAAANGSGPRQLLGWQHRARRTG